MGNLWENMGNLWEIYGKLYGFLMDINDIRGY